jgi:NAD(P)-dependent dehydrogenase (short-subunit alcohol dehydrogenase family)
MTLLMEGRVAAITGAASGIGLAAARLFHAEGAKVVLADVSGEEHAVARVLGQRSVAITVNVAKSSDVRAMVDLAISTYGGIDVLCNVAGVAQGHERIADTLEDVFDKVFNVNTRGAFLTMKYAIPHMVARGGGAIVNVGSTDAIRPFTRGLYSASKAGIVALTKVVATEYGRDGVRANIVCPGATETPPLLESVAGNPERMEMLKSRNPLGRLASPEDVARAMLFLASNASAYLTGAVVPVDGGFVI